MLVPTFLSAYVALSATVFQVSHLLSLAFLNDPYCLIPIIGSLFPHSQQTVGPPPTVAWQNS